MPVKAMLAPINNPALTPFCRSRRKPLLLEGNLALALAGVAAAGSCDAVHGGTVT